MEKTIELISGKLNNVEKDVDDLWNGLQHVGKVVNSNADINDCNFNIIENFMKKTDDCFKTAAKALKSQSKFNKLMFVGLIAGGYILYKQDKAIKELQAKNEEQVTTEE